MNATSLYPILIPCEQEQLVGVVHRSAGTNPRGVVVVVAGGPQYRAGAHRQFIALARRLADAGYPVLRFDLRGMGDSSGEHRGYQQSRPDIAAAIDAFMKAEPQLREVVLFGECESASGILFYGYCDARVRGAVLVNPWVRTVEGLAQAYVKHYYLDRLTSRAFWNKVRSGEYKPLESIGSFLGMLLRMARGKIAAKVRRTGDVGEDFDHLPLPSRTGVGFRRFRGKVLLLMSKRDHIAREFDEVTVMSDAWKGLLDDPRVTRCDLDADHTFSNAAAKKLAQDAVLDWLRAW